MALPPATATHGIPSAFATPTIGAIEKTIALSATPSPISMLLAHEASGYARLEELTTILTSGASLRVAPAPDPSNPVYPTRRAVRNHESSVVFASQVRAQLAEQVADGTTFVLGPDLPEEWRITGSGVFVNPIGCVEKSSSTQAVPVVRIIVDASNGGTQSLNARITKSTVDEADLTTPAYLSNQVIAATLLAAGPGALYSLTDVKAAFNNIALDPSNYRFSVIQFEDIWYCQTRLGFGYRSSPDLFEVVMSAFDGILRTKSHLNILRIVDDILNVDPPGVAAFNANHMRSEMARYGIPIAAAKNVDQVAVVKFNGLEWSAVDQSVTIPAPKTADIRRCISAALIQRPLYLNTIESVTGKLQAVTCVVPDGKAHLQHLYRNMAISKLKTRSRGRATAFISSRYTREELTWWNHRLRNVIPRPMAALAAELVPAPDAIQVFTDACGEGLGVFVASSGAWTYMEVPALYRISPDAHTDAAVAVGSTLIEVAAVVLAIMTYQHTWENQNVHIHSDNSGTVGVFAKRHSSSAAIGSMLTFAVDLCSARNITIHVSWIPGVTNGIADPISRANFAAFRLAAPWAADFPTPCTGSPFTAIPTVLGALPHN